MERVCGYGNVEKEHYNYLGLLILGTVQFGLPYGINNTLGQTSKEEAFQILDLAFEEGIEHLDTAAAYGESEQVLGNYLNTNGDKNFKLITKFDLRDNSCEESLRKSLNLLQTDKIDTLLFHSFNDYLEHRKEAVELIKRYKGRLFNRIGVSVYTNEEISYLLDDEEVEVVQAPFNLLDNEQQRGKILRKVKSAGKAVHTRSVFLQGLFFKVPETFSPTLEPLKSAVGTLKLIADRHGLNMHEMALGYVLSKDYIDGILIGVDSVKQLRENVTASRKSLSEEVIKTIDKIEIAQKELLNPSKWSLAK